MISKKTIKAIEVCVYLAGQRYNGCVTTAKLAPRLGLSVTYLENILKALKDHNLVSAVKGPGGGYMIIGDASSTTVWDVAVAFEKTFHVEQAGEVVIGNPTSYELGLEQTVKETLSQFTLADFVDSSAVEVKAYIRDTGRFKFKPLVVPLMPKAPYSVFNLCLAA